jgi:hypothetical protein
VGSAFEEFDVVLAAGVSARRRISESGVPDFIPAVRAVDRRPKDCLRFLAIARVERKNRSRSRMKVFD